MNILNEIAEKTRERIEKEKNEVPRGDLIREIQQKKVRKWRILKKYLPPKM